LRLRSVGSELAAVHLILQIASLPHLCGAVPSPNQQIDARLLCR
jgi:hypothetical protein